MKKNLRLRISIYCLEIVIAIILIIYFQLNPNTMNKNMSFPMLLIIIALIFQIYFLRKKVKEVKMQVLVFFLSNNSK